MRFCPRCRSHVPPYATHCQACGVWLGAAAGGPPRTVIDPALQQPFPGPAAVPTRRGGSRLALLLTLFALVLGGLFCVCVAAIVAVWMWHGSTRSTATRAIEEEYVPTPTFPSTVRVVESVKSGSRDQTVKWGSRVALTIPGGALRGDSKVTISEIQGAPPPTTRALQAHSTYGIDVKGQHTFDQPLTIELGYDAPSLAQVPGGKLLVGHWDAQQSAWQIVPGTMDASRQVVTVKTRHLSAWRLFYLSRGYGVYESEHFSVVYDPSHAPIIGSSQQEAGPFAQRTASYLEQAWRKYQAAGFGLPWGRTWVFVDAETMESERKNITGNIAVATSFDSADQLRHELAHELFHSVENTYFNVYSMAARRWFMEASADFAADRLVWGGIGTMGKGIKPRYLHERLSLSNGAHEYHSAHFLAWLNDHGVPFKTQWDAVANNTSSIVTTVSVLSSSDLHVLSPLENAVHASSGQLMQEQHRAFSAWLLLDPASPLASAVPSAGSDLNGSLPMGAAASHTLSLPAGYTAKLWTLTIKNTEREPRKVKVELATKVGGAVRVGVFVLPADRRVSGASPRATLFKKGDTTTVQADDGNVVAILATNGGVQGNESVGVKVGEAQVALVLQPSEVKNGALEPTYTFQARATGIPQTVRSLQYEWSWGDGTRSQPASVVRSDDGTAIFSGSHRWSMPGRYSASASLFDTSSGKAKLAEATAPVHLVGLDASVPEAGPPPDLARPDAGDGLAKCIAYVTKCRMLYWDNNNGAVAYQNPQSKGLTFRVWNLAANEIASHALVWTGNSFKAQWKPTRHDPNDPDVTWVVNGTMDFATGDFTSLRAVEEGDFYHGGHKGGRRRREVEIRGIPHLNQFPYHCDHFKFKKLKGAEIPSHVVRYQETYWDNDGKQTNSSTSVDWTNAEVWAQLQLCPDPYKHHETWGK